MRIVLELKDPTYLDFRNLVGKGNMSQVLRNYIESRLENKDNESEKRLRTKYEKIEKEFESTKAKLFAIESTRKAKEKAIREKQESFMEEQAKLIHESKRKLAKDYLDTVI